MSHRCYIAPNYGDFNNVKQTPFDLLLCQNESHHITHVLRKKRGDIVVVFDGKGHVGNAEIKAWQDKQILLQVNHVALIDSQKNHQIHLFQALIKNKSFELVLAKAVELGISHITPLVTAHCAIDKKQWQNKQQKWQQYLINAAKQSGNIHIPIIHTVISLEELIKSWQSHNYQQSYVASLQKDSLPILQKLSPTAQSSALFIGPEGDFSDNEYQQLKEANITAVNLGNHILRAETAMIYSSSVVNAFYTS